VPRAAGVTGIRRSDVSVRRARVSRNRWVGECSLVEGRGGDARGRVCVREVVVVVVVVVWDDGTVRNKRGRVRAASTKHQAAPEQSS
jgi:hypothetical protein